MNFWTWIVAGVLVVGFWRFSVFRQRMADKQRHEELIDRLDDPPLEPGYTREIETGYYVYVPYWLHQLALRFGRDAGHVREVTATYDPDDDWAVEPDEDEDEEATQ